MPETKRKYNKKASTQQLTALKLINEGEEPTKAMLRAGYSPSTARNPKKKLMQSQAVVSIIDKFQLQLKDEGITTAYMAHKMAEWLDASVPLTNKLGQIVKDAETQQPIMIPLYKTQIEAGKMLKEVYNLTPAKEDTSNIKRKIELTEFINS